MAAAQNFFENHKGKLALGAGAGLLSGLVCIQVFMLDSDGKDKNHEGAATASNKEMSAQGGQDASASTHAVSDFFKNYANQMQQGDATAIIATVVIALAVIAMMYKLFNPSSTSNGYSLSSNVGGSNHSPRQRLLAT